VELRDDSENYIDILSIEKNLSQALNEKVFIFNFFLLEKTRRKFKLIHIRFIL